MPKPHDSIAKWLFSQPAYAASELGLLLPAGLVQALDGSSLTVEPGSFIDEELGSSHSDLLYSVEFAGRPAFVYFLFEHQSSVSGLMALRLLRYMVRIWDRYLAQHPEVTALPPIVPVVLHHSASGWTQSTRFHDFIVPRLGELPELAKHVPDFEFLLDDISHQTNDVLLGRDQAAAVRAVLWAMRDARNARRLLDNLPYWSHVLAELLADAAGYEALVRLLRYILEVAEEATFDQVRRRVIETVGVDAEKAMATIAEQLRQEGRQLGRREGEAKGRQEERRRVLLKLLRVRFGEIPADALARVEAADAEQLDRWAERVVTAESLDEVLNA
jgi:predicted transposase YdaD